MISRILKDLILQSRDGDWGVAEPADGHSPFFLIRGTDFNAVRVGDTNAVPKRYLPDRTAGRRTLAEGDILIETAGGTQDQPTGRTLYLSGETLSNFSGAVSCASFARFIRIDRIAADPEFVARYLQFGYQRGMLREYHLQHTGVGRFQFTDFASRFEIPLPELCEQRAIAEVLGALDDKIAANRTASRATGELVQAKATQAARGGVVSTLAELCELVTRGVAPRYAESDGLLVLNQKCIRGGRVSLENGRWTEPLAGRKLEKVLKVGDSLVNSTGQGTLGRVAQWSRDVPATADSHVSIVRWNPELVDPFLAGSLLLQRERDVEALAEGSTGQTELKRDHLGALELVLPEITAQRLVGRDIKVLVEFQNQLDDENEKLAATRDGLLPLLMSGKLRVRDAEKQVGEVV